MQFTDENPDAEDDYDFGERERPPQLTNGANIKYQVQAEIPDRIKKLYENVASFFGRHVAMGNSPQSHNQRHLNQLDMVFTYSRENNVLLAHRGHEINLAFTSETQMKRSNERIGGFERETQQSIFRHERADIHQTQKQPMTEEKKQFLSKFRKNKQEND